MIIIVDTLIVVGGGGRVITCRRTQNNTSQAYTSYIYTQYSTGVHLGFLMGEGSVKVLSRSGALSLQKISKGEKNNK